MSENSTSTQSTAVEQSLQSAVLELVKELKRSRRWKLFFKILGILFLAFIFIIAMIDDHDAKLTNNSHKPHIALIDLQGMIMAGEHANADDFVTALRQAYDNTKTRAIILRVNSPGGSPVQASYMYNEIMRLRHLHPKVKVYGVCTDLCASAAYYVIAASDTVYANPGSLVGSIGVLMNGFGFVDAMNKVGVERRLMTAGTNKGFLDPFLPLNPAHKERADQMLKIIHQQFIHAVEEGRGNRLKKDNPDVYSGMVWTGEEAKTLGLIDGFASAGSLARDVLHQENIVNYTIKQNYFERLTDQFGKASAEHLAVLLGVQQNPLMNLR